MSYSLPFYVLRAEGDALRGERLNAGILALPADAPAIVRLLPDPQRLTALSGQFREIDLPRWQAELPTALGKVPAAHLAAVLPTLALPFKIDATFGTVLAEQGQEAAEVDALYERLVAPPPRSVIRRNPERKKVSRLQAEIRDWLRAAKVYSTKVEDLSRHRVVAEYPIDPVSDLYCDFAVMNGKLHIMETLDLRGVDKLSSAIHGQAALKGITLHEARERIDGRRIAIVQASDYGIARPALNLVQRFADDVWDMNSASDKTAFARFLQDALHNPALPQLQLEDPYRDLVGVEGAL